jgi:hypothetical protein
MREREGVGEGEGRERERERGVLQFNNTKITFFGRNFRVASGIE